MCPGTDASLSLSSSSSPRLDDRDTNNGCKVAGYAVYVDGVRRSKVSEPFGSHVEVEGLEAGALYQIQVRCVFVCEGGRERNVRLASAKACQDPTLILTNSTDSTDSTDSET